MAGVGGEIKRLREGLDWSQPQLAVRAGVAVSAVSQIENGRRSPNVGTLEKIADALGVEVVDLFPKAQAPLQLDLEERSGAPEQAEKSENLYTPYEALGRILASEWEDAARGWDEKIPAEGLISEINFGRLLEWTLEINRTLSAYVVVGRDSGYAQREEMQDTLRIMEAVVSEAFEKLRRAFEPVKTYREFRQILEANDLDAIMSEVESR